MILVTGATGAVGRLVVERLVGAGARVRAVTRTPEQGGLPAGVEVVEGDPSRPHTVAPHLGGVEAVFLHARTIGTAADRLLALAAERGARRVVALSAMNIDDPLDLQPSRLRGDRNKEAEEAAVASGLDWTSLRASAFASNALQAWGGQIRAGDVVRYVYAAFQESPIDERDLAEVAARALLTGEVAGRRLELTGPGSLSHEEMVAVIGAAIGRPLRFEEVPPEAIARHLAGNGLPEPFVRALMDRYTRYAGQQQHPVTGDVEKVLGRPARTFAEWAADHAAAFRR
ncbi:NAD(P)H-binding protein [Nonomuraea basaltis]|uniref:NAD(P)H-binding protein n=1 Tax=Nonomuraea basaltis TaxID=2495887 RepID=UPI00197DCC63|nr:NAD(P)H-binding protein [Nonomuraea basaltis]